MSTEINPKLLDVVEYRVGNGLLTGTVIDMLPDGMFAIEGVDESGVTRRLDVIGLHEVGATATPDARPNVSGSREAQEAFEEGILLLQNGLLDEAKKHFARSFAIDGRLAGALLNSANQLGESGVLDAAMAVYALIMELQPTYEIARENLARAHLNRGVASAKIGALERAILDFDVSMRLRPSTETVNLAHKNIVAAYTKLGIDQVAIKRFEEALNLFVVAFRLDPSDELTARNFGLAIVCSAAWGRRQVEIPAEESFRESLTLGLTYSECLNAYGATLALLGDSLGARRVLERALEIDPTNELPRTNLQTLASHVGIPEPENLEWGLMDMQPDSAHLAAT